MLRPERDLRARMVLAEYLLYSGRIDEVDAVVRALRDADIEDDDGRHRRLLSQCVAMRGCLPLVGNGALPSRGSTPRSRR